MCLLVSTGVPTAEMLYWQGFQLTAAKKVFVIEHLLYECEDDINVFTAIL
jgi:hypothetical protein